MIVSTLCLWECLRASWWMESSNIGRGCTVCVYMHYTVYLPVCMYILSACVCTFHVCDHANIHCAYMYVVCMCMHVCTCILHVCSVVQPVFMHVLHEHIICYMGELCAVYMSCVCMCCVPNVCTCTACTTRVLCMRVLHVHMCCVCTNMYVHSLRCSLMCKSSLWISGSQ